MKPNVFIEIAVKQGKTDLPCTLLKISHDCVRLVIRRTLARLLIERMLIGNH